MAKAAAGCSVAENLLARSSVVIASDAPTAADSNAFML
jgi:hypothetical protein